MNSLQDNVSSWIEKFYKFQEFEKYSEKRRKKENNGQIFEKVCKRFIPDTMHSLILEPLSDAIIGKSNGEIYLKRAYSDFWLLASFIFE